MTDAVPDWSLSLLRLQGCPPDSDSDHGDSTRHLRRIAFLVCLPVVVSWACARPADRASLADLELTVPTLFAAARNGNVVMLEPSLRRLTVWNEAGRRTGSVELPVGPVAERATALAAGAEAALACRPEAGFKCSVIELASGRGLGEFALDQPAAKIAPSADGWVVEEVGAGSAGPIHLLELDGTKRATIDVPHEVIAKANNDMHRAEAATLRLFHVEGALWGVPAGFYEFWHLGGASNPPTVPIPSHLAVAGHDMTGEPVKRKLIEAFSDAPPDVQERLADAIASMPPDPSRVHGYFAAIRSVVTRGSEVLVVVDASPELESGGCRLDLWRAPQLRWQVSAVVEGACPRFVALGRDGAWILQERRFRWLSLRT